jgi:hypothetical protein
MGPIMLWTISTILVILWLLGLGLNLAGTSIHLLLVLALMIVVVDLVTRQRTV